MTCPSRSWLYTEIMKVLKFIGLAVLIIIVAAAIAAGGYLLATWHQNNATNNNSSNNTPSNNEVPVTPLTPVKPTPLTTCNADELTLTTQASGNSGAGTLVIDLVFTNSGKRECILGGFPGVSLVNENGNMIGKPAERATNYPEKTLTLNPGDKVYAELSYEESGNYDPGVCADGATKIRAYAPNDAGYVSVEQTAITSWCPGFEISPVLAF